MTIKNAATRFAACPGEEVRASYRTDTFANITKVLSSVTSRLGAIYVACSTFRWPLSGHRASNRCREGSP